MKIDLTEVKSKAQFPIPFHTLPAPSTLPTESLLYALPKHKNSTSHIQAASPAFSPPHPHSQPHQYASRRPSHSPTCTRTGSTHAMTIIGRTPVDGTIDASAVVLPGKSEIEALAVAYLTAKTKFAPPIFRARPMMRLWEQTKNTTIMVPIGGPKGAKEKRNRVRDCVERPQRKCGGGK